MSVTYYDADLLLRVYDLRRESRLRDARDFVLTQCHFKDYADFKKKYSEENEQAQRHIGMVFTYWDMVCALVARGLLDEELFSTCNGEHVFLWFKFKPVILGRRAEYGFPELLSSLEKVATRHPAAVQIAQFVASQPPTKQAAAKAKRKAASR
jgi:hypothetical protein